MTQKEEVLKTSKDRVNKWNLRLKQPEMQLHYREYQQHFVKETIRPYLFFCSGIFLIAMIVVIFQMNKKPKDNGNEIELAQKTESWR